MGNRWTDTDDAVVLCAQPASASRSKHKYTPNEFVAEDTRERRLVDEHKKVYDEVLASIRGADALLILGPG